MDEVIPEQRWEQKQTDIENLNIDVFVMTMTGPVRSTN
ncbi:glycerol-3-phosphate cytidylyltransferase-like family protein [Paenibacillus sp. DS2015]